MHLCDGYQIALIILWWMCNSICMANIFNYTSNERVSDDGGYHPLPFSYGDVPLVRLTRDLLAKDRYDTRIRPVVNHSKSLEIHISMSLYQLIDVDEPSQTVKMNVWMIQRWSDEMLSWNPYEYGMINETILPHRSLWIPDTYLYNSVVMSRDETERYMNIRVRSRYWEGKIGSNITFLYPAIETFMCRLNVRYFPYDQQNCTLTISSWTNSKSALDYSADERVNMESFIRNDEWDVISFHIYRHEHKYACCTEPWVLIQASLVIRRKPLYYVVNLVIPTAIITIVSITGFFTPASTNDDRTEKINMGITTLLAMSILMLMVSDQMPTTSEFVPLIAWFYLSIIIIISIGTFLTTVVLNMQGKRRFGQMPSDLIRVIFFVYLANWLCIPMQTQLAQLWEEMNDHPIDRRYRRKVWLSTIGARLANETEPSYRFKESKRAFGRKVDNLEQKNETQKIAAEKPFAKKSRFPSSASMRSKLNWSKLALNTATIIDERSQMSATDDSDSTTLKSPVAMTRSRQGSLWESTMIAAGFSSEKPILSKDKGIVSNELIEMKRKRQSALEWEFLATILDRLLLILFIFTVFIVTFGLILTGHMAQADYGE